MIEDRPTEGGDGNVNAGRKVRFLEPEAEIPGRNRLNETATNETERSVQTQSRYKDVVVVGVVGSQVGSLSGGVEPTEAVIQFTGGTL